MTKKISNHPAEKDWPYQTIMYAEAAEAGDAAERFLTRNRATLDALGQRLRAAPPSMVVTCARGSSDHAATYGKYLIETKLGVATTSAAFSTVSLYHAPVACSSGANPLCIAISQSGRSPDMLATVARHKDAGALVVALVNDETSPLAALADVLLPLCAGPETSVAATKSYIASLVGLAAIVAAWSDDDGLRGDLHSLPALLRQAFERDWSAALDDLARGPNLFVIGRGYTLAIAQEAALKLKETSSLHGEGFSSAEARHGPMAIVGDGFPILAFAAHDAAGEDVRALCTEFSARGARVWLADSVPPEGAGVGHLPLAAVRPEFAPLVAIASFYRLVNLIALKRGQDPDKPPYLNKVTCTR